MGSYSRRYYIQITMQNSWRAGNLLHRRTIWLRSGLESGYGVRAVTSSVTSGTNDSAALASAKPFEQMPCLTSLPIIGSAWVYMPLIGRYSLQKLHLADKHKHEVYGDVVREKLGHLSAVSSFRPEDMETIFRSEGQYPARGEFTTLKAYRESRKQWYKTTGIMVLKGKEWHDLRSKTQKHLMKPKAIQSFMGPMHDVATDLVNRVTELKDKNNEVPHFLGELYKWALEGVAFVGLDTRLGCLNSNLSPDSDGMKMINSVQTQFECMNKLEAFTGNFQWWKYFTTPTWRKFTAASDVFTEIAFKYINKALDNLKNSDEDKELTLLQQMLMTKGLDVSGAMVTVADMLMAGIDTTSHTVGFLLYHLAKNPDKQKILHEEVKRVLPNEKDKLTPSTFGELRYLKSCLKESIRLSPITRGNARTLDRDVVISGYRVPAGTAIFCILQVVGRKEKYFKNANQFIPERWLDKEQKISDFFAYVPFGIGPRACIGRRLAELEMITLICEIIKKFKVEYHHEDLDMYTRLVNIPDKPLRFNFIER